MPRWVELAPGQRLTGAVPLVATDTSAPLFPGPGRYTLTGTFDAGGGTVAASPAAVAVERTAPGDRAGADRAAALRDRDVLQSLLSASVLGAAAGGLDLLAAGGSLATRTLAALALGRLDEVVAGWPGAPRGPPPRW